MTVSKQRGGDKRLQLLFVLLRAPLGSIRNTKAKLFLPISAHLLSGLGVQVNQGFRGDPEDPKKHNKHKMKSTGVSNIHQHQLLPTLREGNTYLSMQHPQ